MKLIFEIVIVIALTLALTTFVAMEFNGYEPSKLESVVYSLVLMFYLLREIFDIYQKRFGGGGNVDDGS